ncbi:ornithine acetyltransferase, partial [Pseudomonas aeruginosa]
YPNWGRIFAAIGYTQSNFDTNNVDILIEDIPVMKGSTPIAYDIDTMHYKLKNKDIHININMHQGNTSSTAWGCDLTYDYVKINA